MSHKSAEPLDVNKEFPIEQDFLVAYDDYSGEYDEFELLPFVRSYGLRNWLNEIVLPDAIERYTTGPVSRTGNKWEVQAPTGDLIIRSDKNAQRVKFVKFVTAAGLKEMAPEYRLHLPSSEAYRDVVTFETTERGTDGVLATFYDLEFVKRSAKAIRMMQFIELVQSTLTDEPSTFVTATMWEQAFFTDTASSVSS